MPESKMKTGRWGRLLLVVSLGLNLAVIGAVVGVVLKGGPRNGPPRYDLTVGPLTRALDDERRDAVRDVLRESGVFRPADRQNIRNDMRAIVESLRAEEFDQTAFRDALARQRERLQAGQDAVLEVFAAQIDEMSFEERLEFADRVEQQMRRGATPRRN